MITCQSWSDANVERLGYRARYLSPEAIALFH